VVPSGLVAMSPPGAAPSSFCLASKKHPNYRLETQPEYIMNLLKPSGYFKHRQV
jgi:hypothetical protein